MYTLLATVVRILAKFHIGVPLVEMYRLTQYNKKLENYQTRSLASPLSPPPSPLPPSTHLDKDGQALPEGVVWNHLHSSCSLIETHDQSFEYKVSMPTMNRVNE